MPLLLGSSGPPPATEAGLMSPYNFTFDFVGPDSVVNGTMLNKQGPYVYKAVATPEPTVPNQWHAPGTLGALTTPSYTPPAPLSDSGYNASVMPFEWLDQVWLFGDQLTGLGPNSIAYDNSATAKAFAVLTSIDFGFVAVGVNKNVILFNTYRAGKDITEVDAGGLSGVSTDLTVPFLLKLGASKIVLISISAQGEISILGAISFVITDAADPNIDITGTRAIVFPYEPSWDDPPDVELIVLTEVYQSTKRIEQRSTSLQSGEYDIEIGASYGFEDKTDRKRVYNRLVEIRSRPALIGFPTERMIASADAAGLATITITNILFTDMLLNSLLILRLDNRDRHFFEVRNATAVNTGSNQITVSAAWSASIPVANQVFYFLLPVNLNSVERDNLTDEVHTMRLRWVGLPI